MPIQPTIGIITALPKEYAAVDVLLENSRDYVVPGPGAGRRYRLGTVSVANSGQHSLVLSLADIGNNIAAARATLLLEHFPSITSIIMVGIAGGVPHPKKRDEHVRLGDIVVSDQGGVIQYDFDKEEIDITIHRHPPRPPSATLLEGVRLLQVVELKGERPWLKFIEKACSLLYITRPPAESDILVRSTHPKHKVRHPDDLKRVEGQPRIFTGPIASANKLLKNPLKRDYLRDKFKIKAVEMEGSGIADASWNYERGYLVVRGICDYCDANKGDDWHSYAAIVAAAYTRALLESMPVLPSKVKPPIPQPPQLDEISKLKGAADQLTLWKKAHHSLQEAVDGVIKLSESHNTLENQVALKIQSNTLVRQLSIQWGDYDSEKLKAVRELKQLEDHFEADYHAVKELSEKVTLAMLELLDTLSTLKLPEMLFTLGSHLAELRISIMRMFRETDEKILNLAGDIENTCSAIEQEWVASS